MKPIALISIALAMTLSGCVRPLEDGEGMKCSAFVARKSSSKYFLVLDCPDGKSWGVPVALKNITAD